MIWEASQQGPFQPCVRLGFLGLACMKDKRISDAEKQPGRSSLSLGTQSEVPQGGEKPLWLV